MEGLLTGLNVALSFMLIRRLITFGFCPRLTSSGTEGFFKDEIESFRDVVGDPITTGYTLTLQKIAGPLSRVSGDL